MAQQSTKSGPTKINQREPLTLPAHCATKMTPVVHSFFVWPAVFCELQVYSMGSKECGRKSARWGKMVEAEVFLTKRSEEG